MTYAMVIKKIAPYDFNDLQNTGELFVSWHTAPVEDPSTLDSDVVDESVDCNEGSSINMQISLMCIVTPLYSKA